MVRCGVGDEVLGPRAQGQEAGTAYFILTLAGAAG